MAPLPPWEPVAVAPTKPSAGVLVHNDRWVAQLVYAMNEQTLGCHVRMISGVSLSLKQHQMAERFPPVPRGSYMSYDQEREYIRKDNQRTVAIDKFYGSYESANQVAQNADANAVFEEGWKRMQMKAARYDPPIYIFSDSLKELKGYAYAGHNFNTGSFARWLSNKEGMTVVTSPLVQNPMHVMQSDFSMCRVWMVIPPQHNQRVVRDTEIVKYGKEVMDATSWHADAVNRYGDFINNIFKNKDLRKL